MASLLRDRGVQFEVVVDEGGVIIEEGIQPFTDVPVAIIGTSEKVGRGCCLWGWDPSLKGERLVEPTIPPSPGVHHGEG